MLVHVWFCLRKTPSPASAKIILKYASSRVFDSSPTGKYSLEKPPRFLRLVLHQVGSNGLPGIFLIHDAVGRLIEHK